MDIYDDEMRAAILNKYPGSEIIGKLYIKSIIATCLLRMPDGSLVSNESTFKNEYKEQVHIETPTPPIPLV